jgi:ATP-dependent protease ClpP protease subunit
MLKYTKILQRVIATNNNTIFYDGAVNRKNVLLFNDLIRIANGNNKRNIDIYLTSNGGDLMYAFLVYDLLKKSPKQINMFCHGYVISAASIIYLGGHTRYITPNSTMMIHQVSGSMKGTFNQLQDCYNGYKLSMDCMKKIYINEL